MNQTGTSGYHRASTPRSQECAQYLLWLCTPAAFSRTLHLLDSGQVKSEDSVRCDDRYRNNYALMSAQPQGSSDEDLLANRTKILENHLRGLGRRRFFCVVDTSIAAPVSGGEFNRRSTNQQLCTSDISVRSSTRSTRACAPAALPTLRYLDTAAIEDDRSRRNIVRASSARLALTPYARHVFFLTPPGETRMTTVLQYSSTVPAPRCRKSLRKFIIYTTVATSGARKELPPPPPPPPPQIKRRT